MKTEELSGKRKRAPTKAFVPAESQKRMRVSKRDKGKVQYDTAESESEEEDYEVEFIVEDRYIKNKRQFKVRWVNYGPKDDTWVNEADMSCPRLVSDYEKKKKEEEDEDDEEADYEVEECVDWRMVGGKREFLIKWKNFTSRNNTWEPESNLDCPQMMKKCLEKKGDGKISPAKKGSKKPVAKKITPKKGGKRGRPKSTKNGKKSDDEAEEHDEEDAAEDEPDKEADAPDEEVAKDEEEENKAEPEEEEESKNDADDEEDDEKVDDKRRSKPGPKSKKKK